MSQFKKHQEDVAKLDKDLADVKDQRDTALDRLNNFADCGDIPALPRMEETKKVIDPNALDSWDELLKTGRMRALYSQSSHGDDLKAKEMREFQESKVRDEMYRSKLKAVTQQIEEMKANERKQVEQAAQMSSQAPCTPVLHSSSGMARTPTRTKGSSMPRAEGNVERANVEETYGPIRVTGHAVSDPIRLPHRWAGSV